MNQWCEYLSRIDFVYFRNFFKYVVSTRVDIGYLNTNSEKEICFRFSFSRAR